MEQSSKLGVHAAHDQAARAPTPCRRAPLLQALGGEGQRGLAAPLVDVLFGCRAPAFAPTPPAWQPLNSGLDESQQRAVSLALAAQDVALIHGGWVAMGARLCLLQDARECSMTGTSRAGLMGACGGLQFGGKRKLLSPSLRAPLPPSSPSPLLHAGPPGTGKTTAVIEVICQEVARGK